MSILQSIKMALSSILSNKMRSFLTVLGVIIGVIAVVVLSSLGEGAMDTVTGQIEDLGANLFQVRVKTDRYTGIDVDNLAALVDGETISAVSPSISQSVTAKSSLDSYECTLEGVGASYYDIRALGIEKGVGITQMDNDLRLPVCVVGVKVADKLFGTRDVIGNTVSVRGYDFKIVGLLEEQGASMVVSDDETITIPFTLAQRIFGTTSITSFYASGANESVMDAAEQTLRRFVSARVNDPDDDYSITSQSAILDMMNEVTGTLTTLITGIAGIALLVGGIGIMNIMLVSVTERTREIGIRKAIGAPRSAILFQFLIEAVVLSVAGGLIGLFASMGLLAMLRGPMDMPNLAMTTGSASLALSFAVFIGIIFGIYPANKASKLKPIDALRHE